MQQLHHQQRYVWIFLILYSSFEDQKPFQILWYGSNEFERYSDVMTIVISDALQKKFKNPTTMDLKKSSAGVSEKCTYKVKKEKDG